jgi:hypothetical protein
MATLLVLGLSLGMFRTAVRRTNARRSERRQLGELNEKLEAYRREERDQGASEAED